MHRSRKRSSKAVRKLEEIEGSGLALGFFLFFLCSILLIVTSFLPIHGGKSLPEIIANFFGIERSEAQTVPTLWDIFYLTYCFILLFFIPLFLVIIMRKATPLLCIILSGTVIYLMLVLFSLFPPNDLLYSYLISHTDLSEWLCRDIADYVFLSVFVIFLIFWMWFSVRVFNVFYERWKEKMLKKIEKEMKK